MHGLEIVNGKVSFATRRVPAWHGLTEPINAEHMTWQEVGKAAHLLDWNVRLESASKVVGDNYNFGNKNPFFVLRDNPFGTGKIDVLGEVTNRYRIFSNEATLEFADTLVNGKDVESNGALDGFSKLSWETAGAIDEGRRIFGSLALEREITIDSNGANDVVKIYLLVTSSHDGSTKLTVMVTPVRVVCQNTLNFALNGAAQCFKVKHTQSMDGRVEEAREALSLTDKYIKVFEKQAVDLHSVKVTDKDFFKLIQVIHGTRPEDNTKGREAKWEKTVETALGFWKADTQENIAGTAWGAVNALTEQLQWNRSVRSGNTDNFFMAGAGFDPIANDTRNSVLKAANELFLV